MMIRLLGIICLFLTLESQAQYYYKDIVTSRQTTERIKKYRMQKVRSVKVLSYEGSGEPTPGFQGSQSITSNFTIIKTAFNTPLEGESQLTTFFNAGGQLIKTVDTLEGSGSESSYIYNDAGSISKIVNVSTSPGHHQENEVHMWLYDVQGRPNKMLRIRNGSDTTHVNFTLDENGNVAEENSVRNGRHLPSYYYYYDNKGRLTDVVTYNEKAKRLLPLYIFEYNEADDISSMMVIPEGSDDYQKWYYEYGEGKLKTKETCFNKHRQVMGRIEYVYD